jgi:hypothetical protein
VSELRKFVENIARMKYDGEQLEGYDEDGYIMENDDAVETLSGLIQDARQLLGPLEKASTTDVGTEQECHLIERASGMSG